MTRQQKGELIHIRPDGQYRHENPFRATIAMNYESQAPCGTIRFEPALDVSEEYTDGAELDLGVWIVPMMKLGNRAAIYAFSFMPDFMEGMSEEDRIAQTALQIINDAGALISDNILALEATEDLRCEV